MDKRIQKALISVRVTTNFKKELEQIAESKNMAFPDFIRFVLFLYVEENKLNNKKMKE